MSFVHWVGNKRREPYGSWGNGSAIRVSPVGFAFDSLDVVLAKAKESADLVCFVPIAERLEFSPLYSDQTASSG